MNIVVAEFLDFDIGHKYGWWHDSNLELWGSWNNWTAPTPCVLAVICSKFYGYGLITLTQGVHEYKWKYTGTCSLGRTSDWFNDRSCRPIVSSYKNQLLDTSDHSLYTTDYMPRLFDDIYNYRNRITYGTILDHIGRNKIINHKPRDNFCLICFDQFDQNITESNSKNIMICINEHGVCNECYTKWASYSPTHYLCPYCNCDYATRTYSIYNDCPHRTCDIIDDFD